jgi:phage portal protein BeeE
MKAAYSNPGHSSALQSDSTPNTLNQTIAAWCNRVAAWLSPRIPAPRIYQHMDRSGLVSTPIITPLFVGYLRQRFEFG